jgi:hypothetical protein
MKTSRAPAKTVNVKTPGLLVAMTGKASPAKAAEGDAPVYAYIASLPQPQRGIAERIDALATETLPDLQRAVKWGMAYYGVGGGWCFTCGAFVGHEIDVRGRCDSRFALPQGSGLRFSVRAAQARWPPVVDARIPFPGSGHQREFEEAMSGALGMIGWGRKPLGPRSPAGRSCAAPHSTEI